MPKYSNHKEIRRLVSSLIDQGWIYQRGKKHGSIHPPSGRRVTVPSTPSDYRAFYNFRQQVKAVNLDMENQYA